jgi:Fe-S cluster assembly iron-binding protein IscA
MLALTENAEQAVEAIVSQPETPDGAVLRLSATDSRHNGTDPAGDLQLAVVDGPEEGDAILEGVAISVEPDTVDYLDDKVLDAEIAEGNVRFSLYLQRAEPAGPGDGSLEDDA